MVVAEAELARRADHPVRDTSIRFAGADREASRQHDAGQRDGHSVAYDEIRCAAHNSAERTIGRAAERTIGRAAQRAVLAEANLDEADRLLEFRELLDGDDLADDDPVDRRIADAEQLDAFHLQPRVGQRLGAGVSVRQSGHQLA